MTQKFFKAIEMVWFHARPVFMLKMTPGAFACLSLKSVLHYLKHGVILKENRGKKGNMTIKTRLIKIIRWIQTTRSFVVSLSLDLSS